MTSTEDLVSVVIPAHNAEATLDETLCSVRQQSYLNLEIVVVDDGSSDTTAEIVQSHAGEDLRIRLVSLENSGVAAARNAGIAASRGAYIAPLDADDLWHPEKIARQMAAMRAGGPRTGLVYAFYRKIDEDSRVIFSAMNHVFEGEVYLRLLLLNFVGNGSAPLIRRQALVETGGYDPDLRTQNAQGCEDYLMQILIARTWKVGCVPAYLVGYRWTAQGMSRNSAQMMRSHLLTLAQVRRRFPETPIDLITAAEAKIRASFAVRELHRLNMGGALVELWRAGRLDARVAAETAQVTARSIARGVLRRRMARIFPRQHDELPHFMALEPSMREGRPAPLPLLKLLTELAGMEAGFFASQLLTAQRDAVAGDGIEQAEAGGLKAPLPRNGAAGPSHAAG